MKTTTPTPPGQGPGYNPTVMSYIREDWIQHQLVERQADYTSTKPISLWTGTWNVNAKKPLSCPEDCQAWLGSSSSAPDVYAIGFQEIVDLNAVNVVVNNSSHHRSQQWQDLISKYLTTRGQYELVVERHLVGILLLVYIKSELAMDVADVQVASAGVGVLGLMGNKGGVAIRFRLCLSSFCFVCSHLAAHRENIAGRNADYHNILNKVEFQPTRYSSSQRRDSGERLSYIEHDAGGSSAHAPALAQTFGVLDHNFVFWLGDLNYRITEGRL